MNLSTSQTRSVLAHLAGEDPHGCSVLLRQMSQTRLSLATTCSPLSMRDCSRTALCYYKKGPEDAGDSETAIAFTLILIRSMLRSVEHQSCQLIISKFRDRTRQCNREVNAAVPNVDPEDTGQAVHGRSAIWIREQSGCLRVPAKRVNRVKLFLRSPHKGYASQTSR